MSKNYFFYLRDQLIYTVSVPNLLNYSEVSDKLTKGHYSNFTTGGTQLTLTGQGTTSTLTITKKKILEGRNPWLHVGGLADLDDIRKRFPDTEFCYGVRYNRLGEVMINGWNGKTCIVTYKHNYPQGDGKNMFVGNCIFKRGTQDYDSNQSPKWLHQYVTVKGDGIYTERGGNGYINPNFYVKYR